MIYILIFAAVIGLGGAGFGWWQMSRANDLEVALGTANSTIRDQNTKIASITEENHQCREDVLAANKSVDALKTAEKERAAAAEAAVREAQEAARTHRLAAEKFRARPPSKPDDLCVSTKDILTDYLKHRRGG